MPPLYPPLPPGSPITNRWGEVTPTAVPAEHRTVFVADDGRYYNHHAQITLRNGRLFATWSQGVVHEDDVGQVMVLSTSDDGGDTWSEPRPIVDRQPGEFADAVVVAGGVRVHEGRLVGYHGQYDYTGAGLADGHRHLRNKHGLPMDVWWEQHVLTGVVVSDDGGKTWSAPRTIIERGLPNLCARPTASGRLIMPGHIRFPYTDDRAGLSGWRNTGLPRVPSEAVDGHEGMRKACRLRGDERDYEEGSFFQTDDRVIHMMLRTNTLRLAVTESHDDGETWSEPVFTSYTDCRCKHQFGRLPDGRFYGLTCPDPVRERGRQRTPLVLATSYDGVVFDRHYILGAEPELEPRREGLGKTGRYSYPTMHIADGMAYVVYAIHKEDIGMCRFPLSALG